MLIVDLAQFIKKENKYVMCLIFEYKKKKKKKNKLITKKKKKRKVLNLIEFFKVNNWIYELFLIKNEDNLHFIFLNKINE